MAGQPEDHELLQTLDTILTSPGLDNEEEDLLEQLKTIYSDLLKHLGAQEISAERIQPLQIEATYLTSLAGVATFLGAVQIGFIAFTALHVGPVSAMQRTHVQRTIDFFSYCALSFDALGALFALVTSGSLLFATSAANSVTVAKQALNKNIKTFLDDLAIPNRQKVPAADFVRLIQACEKQSRNSLKLQHLFNDHLTGSDLEIIMVVVVGTVFFFVSLITFVISTQPHSVWIPFTVVFGIAGFVLLFKHSRRHPGIWRALRRALQR